MRFWMWFLMCLLLAAVGMLAVYARRWHRLRRQYRAMEEELQRQTGAAQAEQNREKDLVAFLAHDLKTPLTSVVGYLTILGEKEDLTGEERARFTAVALEKARRLEALLEEFFDISRMELQGDRHRREPVDLSLLLAQLTDEFYPLLEEKQLTLDAQIDPGLWVTGDGDRLARVFDNVLRNAVSYSPAGSGICLRAQDRGAQVVVWVSNPGQGIPEEELTNIFQRFYRLDAARSSATGGAGLGLAIAKEIVDSHGGVISAESTGDAVIFTVSLPRRG